MRTFLIVTFIFSTSFCFAQKMNTNYVMIRDSNNRVHKSLKFLNENTLVITSKPNSGLVFSIADQTSESYKYVISEGKLTISGEDYEEVFEMTNNQYFVNRDKQQLFVLRKIYGDYPDIAVYFDEKYYWIDSPKTVNGIIIKDGRKNRKLSRVIKDINAEDYEITIYRGYEAFEKYGFEYVHGIIEIVKKQAVFNAE